MDLQIVSEKIQTIRNEIQEISGSLRNMNKMDNELQKAMKDIQFGEKHLLHMKACEHAFTLQIMQLLKEQTELMKLLKSQEVVLISLLKDAQCKNISGSE